MQSEPVRARGEPWWWVVPITGRDVAAVAGGLLVATGAADVIGPLIVPRSVAGWLARWVDRVVNGAFRLATRNVAGYKRRDRVLAAQAATILIAQVAAWLVIFCGHSPTWPRSAA